MDFSKFEKLRALTERKTTVIEQGDNKIVKMALVSVVCATVLLIHYVQYMNIQYTTTVIARFLQFWFLFFIIFGVAMYLEYNEFNVIINFFILMSLPYIYQLLEYVFNYMKKLSFYTVKGRIYILTTFLFVVAMFLIVRQFLFS
jgi:hypothetical protein